MTIQPREIENNSPASVLFIDAQIQNYSQLIASIKTSVRFHTLNNRESGIEQITRTLQTQYKNTSIADLYIVAHGIPGCVFLGSGELSDRTWDRHEERISTWKAGSLFLYSCNAAAGSAGRSLIHNLQRVLGVPVLSSTTRAGSATLGGSWTLESVIHNDFVHLNAERSPFLSRPQACVAMSARF